MKPPKQAKKAALNTTILLLILITTTHAATALGDVTITNCWSSTEQSATYNCAKAYDDDSGTAWVAQDYPAYPQYLSFQFATTNISKTEIYQTFFDNYHANNFVVLGSNDTTNGQITSGTWTTLNTTTLPDTNGVGKNITFTKGNYNWIMFKFTDGGSIGLSITDVGVYEDTAPASTNTTYTFNATDRYDDSALDGVTFTTSSGSCVTSGGTCTLSFNTSQGTLSWTANKTSYYGDTGTIDANSTAEGELYQGETNITSITALVTGNTLSGSLGTWTVNTSGGKTYSGGGTTYPTNIYLADGKNNLTLQYSGSGTYYDKDFTVNITAPETTTTTINGVYDSLITINASNAYTGAAINNFTINASNTTTAYTDSKTTTTGTLQLPAEKGASIFLLIDAPGYAYANTTTTPENETQNLSFGLYTQNSIRVYLYDQDTNLPVTANTTIVITGNSSEDTYTTTTGQLYVDNLTDGNYTLKVSATNYTLTTYTVTVAERSTQTVNLYLTQSTENVIFTARDAGSGVTLEDDTISMYRLINGTQTLISTKNTDITGRASFTYTPSVKYCFTSTRDAYTDKSFCLDPILFSSYDVAMTPTTTETQSYASVSTYWTPTTFTNNAENNLTLTISSPTGTLTNYDYTITYPGGEDTYNGTNALGDIFTDHFNITNATFLQTVNITVHYNTVFDENTTRTYQYTIQDANSGGTFFGLTQEDNTYGLGALERILIATLITIIITGLAVLAAGTTPALIVAMLTMGFFSYIGFVPLLALLISLLGSILLLVRRGGE